jgi:hypothetical protein
MVKKIKEQATLAIAQGKLMQVDPAGLLQLVNEISLSEAELAFQQLLSVGAIKNAWISFKLGDNAGAFNSIDLFLQKSKNAPKASSPQDLKDSRVQLVLELIEIHAMREKAQQEFKS